METIQEKIDKGIPLTNKKTVRLTKTDYLKILFYAKLKRVAAKLANKITSRQYQILALSNKVLLDDSKTEWKIRYCSFEPAELVYGEQLVATVIACDNPPKCNLELLRERFPAAYNACMEQNGQHLRLNLKK